MYHRSEHDDKTLLHLDKLNSYRPVKLDFSK
jgi:hypothetical protein